MVPWGAGLGHMILGYLYPGPVTWGLRVGGPLSFLLRILQLDQLLPSLCSGLRC